MTTTTNEPTPKLDTIEPIPAASKPMQYRAIGLLWGRYVPRDEITQGILLTSDGTVMEAVVLGKLLRVFLSVKAGIDLEKEHLWVVYPRTRNDEPLHVQMAGIWEPETLHPDSPNPTLEQKPDYFSIQGEVIFQNSEENWVLVRIVQQTKNPSAQPKSFKLKLFGVLPEKAVKNFWNLQVQREGNNLVIKESERVAYLGKKKPKKEKPTKGKPQKQKPEASKDGKQPTNATASSSQIERPKDSNSSQQTLASASPSPQKRPKDSNNSVQPTPAALPPSPKERPLPTTRPAPTKRPAPIERPAPLDTERPLPTERPSPLERPLLKKKQPGADN